MIKWDRSTPIFSRPQKSGGFREVKIFYKRQNKPEFVELLSDDVWLLAKLYYFVDIFFFLDELNSSLKGIAVRYVHDPRKDRRV